MADTLRACWMCRWRREPWCELAANPARGRERRTAERSPSIVVGLLESGFRGEGWVYRSLTDVGYRLCGERRDRCKEGEADRTQVATGDVEKRTGRGGEREQGGIVWHAKGSLLEPEIDEGHLE